MNETEQSNTEDEEAKLRELVNTYIKTMGTGDEERFHEIWHPAARRFSIGNSNELHSFSQAEIDEYTLKGIKQLRKEASDSARFEFVLDEVLHFSIYSNLIASVEVKLHMTLPGSEGLHHTYFHLAKQNGKWRIVNALDRGYEYTQKDS